MPNYTPNYRLIKPTDNEYFDIANDNSNMDTIDTILNKKSNQYYIDIVKDYKAVCDGVTDISNIINTAITEINSNGGGTLFIPKQKYNQYRFSGIKLKYGVSIISDGASVKPVDDLNDMFYLDNGAITTINYDFKIKGMNISANANNSNQKIFNFKAYEKDNTGGGLWHAQIEDITIFALSGNMIGINLEAIDSDNSNIDVVNQYLYFKNINIYRNSENATCLQVKGQLGQTQFDNCEFNGTSNELKGYNVKLQSIEGSNNDYLLGTISFDNTTFQWSEKGIYADFCSSLKLNNCWLEKLKNAITIDNGTNLHLDSCHLSELGGSTETLIPIIFGDKCKITGENNYVKGTYGTLISPNSNSVVNRGINVKFNMWRDSPYPYTQIKGTTPIFNATAVKIRCYRNPIIAFNQSAIQEINYIESEHSEGDILTLINIGSNSSLYPNITGVGNILLPKGVLSINLKQNQSITLKKMSQIGQNNIYWSVISTNGEIINSSTRESMQYGHFSITNSQSIANDTNSDILFDKTVKSVTFADLNGNGQLRILENGLYRISVQVGFAVNTTGNRSVTIMNLTNSSSEYSTIIFNPIGGVFGNANDVSPEISIITKAVPNDLIYIKARQNSGSSLNVGNDIKLTKVIITKLS